MSMQSKNVVLMLVFDQVMLLEAVAMVNGWYSMMLLRRTRGRAGYDQHDTQLARSNDSSNKEKG